MNAFDPLVLLAVFGLAGAGSVVRFLLSKWDSYLPFGILLANTVASFIAGYASVHYFNNEFWLVAIVLGLAGGLSTFSSWAAATVQMSARGKIMAPALYSVLTLVCSSTAAYFGLVVG